MIFSHFYRGMQLPTSFVAAEKPQDLAWLSSVCTKPELFQAHPTQPNPNKAKQCRFTCSQHCHEVTVPTLCPPQCCQMKPSTRSVRLSESRAELPTLCSKAESIRCQLGTHIGTHTMQVLHRRNLNDSWAVPALCSHSSGNTVTRS